MCVCVCVCVCVYVCVCVCVCALLPGIFLPGGLSIKLLHTYLISWL